MPESQRTPPRLVGNYYLAKLPFGRLSRLRDAETSLCSLTVDASMGRQRHDDQCMEIRVIKGSCTAGPPVLLMTTIRNAWHHHSCRGNLAASMNDPCHLQKLHEDEAQQIKSAPRSCEGFGHQAQIHWQPCMEVILCSSDRLVSFADDNSHLLWVLTIRLPGWLMCELCFCPAIAFVTCLMFSASASACSR